MANTHTKALADLYTQVLNSYNTNKMAWVENSHFYQSQQLTIPLHYEVLQPFGNLSKEDSDPIIDTED